MCWVLSFTAYSPAPLGLQVLVYFAVAKKGEKPTDGKTDVNPEGLTAGEMSDDPVPINAPPFEIAQLVLSDLIL